MPGTIRVVVGLGNPGPRYESTRHNVGFRVIDRLRGDLEAGDEGGGRAYRVSWAELAGDRVALLKPRLYMNRSGDALARFPESALAGPGGHLVVLDDVWLPFGTLRFRRRGSAGGHLGLESVLERLGTEDVPRLRIGVGGADEESDLADHVLDAFTEEEEKAMEPLLARAAEGIRVFLTDGPETAMNRYNR